MSFELHMDVHYHARERALQIAHYERAIGLLVARQSETSLRLVWQGSGNSGAGLDQPRQLNFAKFLREFGTALWRKSEQDSEGAVPKGEAPESFGDLATEVWLAKPLQSEINSVFSGWFQRTDPSMFIAHGQHRCLAIRSFLSAKTRRRAISSIFDEIDLSIFKNDVSAEKAEEVLSEALSKKLHELIQFRFVNEVQDLRKQDSNPRDSIFEYHLRTGCSPPSNWTCMLENTVIQLCEGAIRALSSFRPPSRQARPPDGHGNRPTHSVSYA